MNPSFCLQKNPKKNLLEHFSNTYKARCMTGKAGHTAAAASAARMVGTSFVMVAAAL
jgi:hypothetical protein